MKKEFVPRYIKWIFVCGLAFLVIMSLLRQVQIAIFPPSAEMRDFPRFQVFFLGMRYDLRIVSIVCLVLLLQSLIPPISPFRSRSGKRISFTIWILSSLTFVLFYLIDFANYAYLQVHMNADLLNLLKDTGDAFKMMWQTYPILLLLLVWIAGTLLLFLMVRFFYNRIRQQQPTATKTGRILFPVLLFLLLAFGIFGRLGQYPLRWSDAFTLGNSYASNMTQNPFQSFFSSLKDRNQAFNLADVKKAYPIMADYLGVDHPDSSRLDYTRTIQGDAAAPKPNIVVVICESFSFYKSSMSGNKLNPTPYFNQMSQNGILFDQCFTPSYGTARGVWAVVTGIPDVDLSQTSSRNPKAVDQHTILNDFKGYSKFYFIGGSLSWANIRGLLTNNIQGLKTYEQDDYNAPKVDVWGVSDKQVFLKANEVFAQQKQPFAAIIQTSDNHRPYTIPEEDRKAFKLQQHTAGDLKDNGFASNEEFNAFRYTDFCYQQFIEAAKKQPYFKNTIFVFVGDHGIRGESKLYPQAWTEELTSEHVPLLFYAPGLLQPQRISEFASQIDLLPTAAGLAKISYTNTTLGRDLLSPFMRGQAEKHAAFIFDYNDKSVGVVKDSLYFRYGLGGNIPEKALSLKDNHPVFLSQGTKAYYRQLTDALYNTSRYMILNNHPPRK